MSEESTDKEERLSQVCSRISNAFQSIADHLQKPDEFQKQNTDLVKRQLEEVARLQLIMDDQIKHAKRCGSVVNDTGDTLIRSAYIIEQILMLIKTFVSDPNDLSVSMKDF